MSNYLFNWWRIEISERVVIDRCIDGIENSENAEVNDDWFKSLDDNKAIEEGFNRNADGTINTNGFLELTEKAPSE